jgi:hypothetical protein
MNKREISSGRGFGSAFEMCSLLRSKGSCRHDSSIFPNLSWSGANTGRLCKLTTGKDLSRPEPLGGLGGLPTPPFTERLSFPPFRLQQPARHPSLLPLPPARSPHRQGRYETPWKISSWITQIAWARFVAVCGRVERVSPRGLSVHSSRTTNQSRRDIGISKIICIKRR